MSSNVIAVGFFPASTEAGERTYCELANGLLTRQEPGNASSAN